MYEMKEVLYSGDKIEEFSLLYSFSKIFYLLLYPVSIVKSMLYNCNVILRPQEGCVCSVCRATTCASFP